MSRFIDHKGTYRLERLPKALGVDYFKLDDRSAEDLMAQTAQLASHIKFYNEQNLVDGNWEDFFDEVYDYVTGKVTLEAVHEKEAEAQVPPHIALYLAFIEVFQVAQDELNRFTQRHLEYYYVNILKFERKDAVSDQVHLFFGIDNKENKALVPQGTLFDGGNDNNGKKRQYASDFDVIVNKSEIDQVKTVTIDALHSNVQDNILNDKTPRPFELGFAIASPVFYLKDGLRQIEVHCVTADVARLVKRCHHVEYSAAEGWQLVDIDGSSQDDRVIIKIAKALPPFAAYAESVHQMQINAKDPVLRFVFGESLERPFDDVIALLGLSSNPVSSITVEVKESADLTLYNDYGKVTNGVPFLPFGPNPLVGSSRLLLGNNKIFNKYLDKDDENAYEFNVEWRGLPDDLVQYYSSYQEGMERFGIDDYGRFSEGIRVFAENLETNKNPFPGVIDFLEEGVRSEMPEDIIPDADGMVKVVLETDFGLGVYGKLLSKVMMENTKMVESKGLVVSNEHPAVIPEKPYLPEIQIVKISYKLKTDSAEEGWRLFALHPFMNEEVKEEDGHRLYQIHAPEETLQEGQSQKCYYFGVANAEAGSELSIYFDIDNPIINDKNQYSWSYFGQGSWNVFDEKAVVRDNTSRLGKSGVITFVLPEDIKRIDNKIWLCLSMVSVENKFPTVLNARSNCVTATFVDDGNELSHLKAGLPAQTIQKFVERDPKIKTVEQPYPSSGGKEAERDSDFYIRVSERLRHKGRASTAWDYERLALEAFPQISFALCMSHTRLDAAKGTMEFAPGCIALLVSPDVDVVRQEDKFKPVVPALVVNEIRTYLQGLSSAQVNMEVANFIYKEVQVSCVVQLRKEFTDKGYYRDKLDTDLKTFISPWTGGGDDKFGKNMTYNSKNVADIYSFLEQLEYVDFVESAEIRMEGKTYTIADKTLEKNQNEIFTSAKNHVITIK